MSSLPDTPLYGGDEAIGKAHVGWPLSPEPYAIDAEREKLLQKLGPCLQQFLKVTNLLYRQSLKKPEWAWVKQLFEYGKPESLLKLSQMNRFKQDVHLVIRPDLMVTDDGFVMVELDTFPCGMGIMGALHQAYQSLGFPVVGGQDSIPKAFLDMLLASKTPNDQSEPFIAIIVSDDYKPYWQELTWLVTSIQAFYPNIALVEPKQVALRDKELGFISEQDQFQRIDLIYRYFSLHELPMVPQMDLIQYAIKKGLVTCVPPFKPQLEEKLTLGLLHHPDLESFWIKELGEESFLLLKSITPVTWILDPTPVPYHASVTPPLWLEGKQLRDFTGLGQLTQKQRQLVLKPSGFSYLAGRSRGVTVGHDVSQEEWQARLQEAFDGFEETPYVLQRYHNPKAEPYCYYHPETGELTEGEGRTRFSPYYFTHGDTVTMAGVLCTTCPKDKKVVHGMSDGVMRPAMVVSE